LKAYLKERGSLKLLKKEREERNADVEDAEDFLQGFPASARFQAL
jgi:hypothetical protein